MLSSSETDLVTSDDDFSDASGTSNLVSADDEPRRTGAPATPDDSIMEWTSSSEGILHDDPGNTSASMPTVLGQPWIGKVCSRLVSENTLVCSFVGRGGPGLGAQETRTRKRERESERESESGERQRESREGIMTMILVR